jgi:hypothetical protein
MDPQIHQATTELLVLCFMQGLMLILLFLFMAFTFAAVAAIDRKEDGPRKSRGTRAGRGPATPTKAEEKRAAEEKALNDAIEAAVNKLMQGNQP